MSKNGSSTGGTIWLIGILFTAGFLSGILAETPLPEFIKPTAQPENGITIWKILLATAVLVAMWAFILGLFAGMTVRAVTS